MRSRRPLLLVALLLAAVLGLLRSSADILDSLQAHAICPRDGEIIHVGNSPAHTQPNELRALAVPLHGEACFLALTGMLPAAPLPPPAPSFAEAPPFAAVEVGTQPATTAFSSHSLLSRAPKTSPPLAV